MKLLIDIPEHVYEHAKETTEDSRDEFDAMRAIANGIQQESRSEIPNTCGDAISRDKAIVQLSHLLSDWDDDWNVGIRKCIETVKSVKSVTPQQRTGRWIGAEVLDKIRAELHATAELHEDGDYYLRDEWIDEYFDKYKAESEDKE